jgi:hypothetical protein
LHIFFSSSESCYYCLEVDFFFFIYLFLRARF